MIPDVVEQGLQPHRPLLLTDELPMHQLRRRKSAGKLEQQLQAYRGAPGQADFEGGIRWAGVGATAILGRPGG